MHTLIVGITNSGKTKLAKCLAARKDSESIVVFDPIRSEGWPAGAKKFSDPDLFFDFIDQAQSKYVFIDESKILWDFDKDRAEKLVYTGRHRGLYLFLLAQRTRMISPNGRNQCSKVFAFKQQKVDADTLAAEYNETMREAVNLKECEFICTDGFDIQTGHLVFDESGAASIVLDI